MYMYCNNTLTGEQLKKVYTTTTLPLMTLHRLLISADTINHIFARSVSRVIIIIIIINIIIKISSRGSNGKNKIV